MISIPDDPKFYWKNGHLRCCICQRMEKSPNRGKKICDDCYGKTPLKLEEEEMERQKARRISIITHELTVEKIRRFKK